jgi:hypothetical protein
MLVSHSPPSDRLALLNSVYWHRVDIKRVQRTPWEHLDEAQGGVPEERLIDCSEDTSSDDVFEPGGAWVYVLTK